MIAATEFGRATSITATDMVRRQTHAGLTCRPAASPTPAFKLHEGAGKAGVCCCRQWRGATCCFMVVTKVSVPPFNAHQRQEAKQLASPAAELGLRLAMISSANMSASCENELSA